MKKLLAVIAILAMAVSYLPAAEAGDSATLGLKVTFDIPDEPLKIWSDPEGPFEAIEGKELTFRVIAEDKDTQHVYLEAVELPKGATFEVLGQLRPDPITDVSGLFNWKPGLGQAQDLPYRAVFKAANAEGDVVRLDVSITVVESQSLRIWSDPEGPFEAIEGKELRFSVIAEDKDAEAVVTIEAVKLPEGAVFYKNKTYVPSNIVVGHFMWTPNIGQGYSYKPGGEYLAVFEARDARKYDGAIARLEVKIIMREAKISIELNETSWIVKNVGFGTKAINKSPIDIYPPEAMHRVTSHSSMNIDVRIGIASYSGYAMGEKPSEGIFTLVLCEDGYKGGSAFMPGKKKLLVEALGPEETKEVPLILYTPMAGDPETGLSAQLSLDAYPSVQNIPKLQ